MKKTFLHCTLAVLFTGTLIFSGCQKLKDDATQTSESAEDASQDLSYMNAMVDLVEDVASSEGFMMKKGKKKIKPDNVPIRYIDTSFTDGDGTEIEVNFGTNPILCLDGFKRSGTLIIRANKPYSQAGCVVQAFTEGILRLEKDDVSVGFYAEEFVDVGAGNEHITLTRTAPDKVEISYIIEIYYNDEDSYPATGNFTVTQTGGMEDEGALGNEYSISGSSKGQNHSGTKYTIDITEDLQRKVDPDCSKTLIKGKMTLKNEGSKTDLKLDFGDGTCDNKVTVTLPGGVKKEISLD